MTCWWFGLVITSSQYCPDYSCRSLLVHEEGIDFDQQRGGTHYIGGAGETQLEKERRVLLEREQKLKKKLQNLKKHREHVRHERHKRHVPTVAVVGYTNAGGCLDIV